MTSIVKDKALSDNFEEIFNIEEVRSIENHVLQPLVGYFRNNRIEEELREEREVSARLRVALDKERGYVTDLSNEVAVLRGAVAERMTKIKGIVAKKMGNMKDLDNYYKRKREGVVVSKNIVCAVVDEKEVDDTVVLATVGGSGKGTRDSKKEVDDTVVLATVGGSGKGTRDSKKEEAMKEINDAKMRSQVAKVAGKRVGAK